ncbi:hypothetical protein Tco_1554416 [Tanacetum coccineum]
MVDPSVRTPRCSEAFMRWRSALLSTLYPPTTSESSLNSSSERSLDSSSPSAGPSCKRCRFRDSYLSEVSREEHIEIGTADVEVVADLGISDGVGAPAEDGLGMGVDVATSDIREDEEFEVEACTGGMIEVVVDPLATGSISELAGGDAPDLEGTLYDISHYMSEVALDRITKFETAQRQLEAGQLEEFGQIRRDRDDTRRRLRRLESLVERRLGFRR